MSSGDEGDSPIDIKYHREKGTSIYARIPIDFPYDIKHEANELYLSLVSHGCRIKKEAKLESYAFYCVYQTLRKYPDRVMSPYKLAILMGIGKKAIAKALTTASKYDLDNPVRISAPDDFLPEFLQDANVPIGETDKARSFLREIVASTPSLTELAPQSLAEGVAYYYATVVRPQADTPIRKPDYAERIGVSVMTLNKILGRIKSAAQA